MVAAYKLRFALRKVKWGTVTLGKGTNGEYEKA